MKLLTPFAAIIAAAAAGQVYSSQPAEAYAHSAEIYQSALEYQQQGLYSDQSHAYSGQNAGAEQLHAYSGQNAGGEQLHGYSGQNAGGEELHAYSGQNAGGEQQHAYSGQNAGGEQQHAYSGQNAGGEQQHAYSGQNAGGEQLHAYSGQDAGHAAQSLAYAGQSGHRLAGEKTARILSYDSNRDGHGYKYSFETENGIKTQEAGQVTGHEKGTEAHGGFSYTGDDGHVYTVTYTADENGFHAQGAHLPTPPPIPELIAKSLEQNAKDEAAGIYDDGKYQENPSYHQQVQQSHRLEQSVGSGHQTQAFQYEAALQHEGFQPGYHSLNVPVEGYKH